MKFVCYLLFFILIGQHLCDAKSIFSKYLGIEDSDSNESGGQQMAKLKDFFKIQVYYEEFRMSDGSIYYVPQDKNKNHYFIG